MAASVLEAGVLMEQFRPSAVLVDIDVPGAGGQTFPHFVASRAEFQGTQLIAAGASITEADRQSLLQQGFGSILAKPFTIRRVAEVVEEAVSIIS